MRLFQTSGALTTITAMVHLVHFTLASKDIVSCAQDCADMSCEYACIDSDGFAIHKTLVNDIANEPLIDENGLSAENPSEPSTHLLQDEEDCDDDDDDVAYDSRDDAEDCDEDEDEDDIPLEYVVDTSEDDEDCDSEHERPSPHATNASSKPAAQVPTSPFIIGSSEDGARPTVTAYTTITSEIISPSADMLHASSNIESDVVESNGHTKARASTSLLGVLPFALLVWLP